MGPGLLHRLTIEGTHEGPAGRTFGFLQQTHARFLGGTVTFLAVALDAGNHDIFPGSYSSTVPGNHMIHIQLLNRKVLSAVLAAKIIAFQKIFLNFLVTVRYQQNILEIL